jgi:hypothetical protein
VPDDEDNPQYIWHKSVGQQKFSIILHPEFLTQRFTSPINQNFKEDLNVTN